MGGYEIRLRAAQEDMEHMKAAMDHVEQYVARRVHDND